MSVEVKGEVYQRLASDYVLSINGAAIEHMDTYYEWRDNRYTPVNLDKEVRKWMVRTKIPQTNTLVANVLPIIGVFVRVDALESMQMPFWRPSDDLPDPLPLASDIIPFKNGLLDVRNPDGGLIPHTPLFVSTGVLPYAYDPTGDCPTWLRFLGEVYEGDPRRIKLLQEWMGYLMTADTRYQKIMALVGKPGAGKGTIFRACKGLLGHNAIGEDADDYGERFASSALASATAAFISEIDLLEGSEARKLAGVMKKVSGEDEIKIKRKYVDSFSTRVNVRFTVSCNDPPELPDSTGALARRWLVLPHNVTFEGREDYDLEKKLNAEMPGIAAWAVEGLLRLRGRNRFDWHGETKLLTEPSSKELTFLRDSCVVSEKADTGGGWTVVEGEPTVRRESLYEAFQKWCGDRDYDASPRTLAKAVRTLLRVGERKEGTGMRVWVGLGLKGT